MHPHGPHASEPRQHRGRRGGDVALGGRPWGRVLGPPDLPEEGLSGGPEQDRLPEVAQRRQAGEQRPVVLGELGEAEPGVEHEPVGADPRGESGVATGGELAAYLRNDVGVCRAVLHVDAVPSPVHDDERNLRRRDKGQHLRVGEPPADIVDERRSGGERSARDLRPHRVDRHSGSLGGQRRHDGNHPTQLLVDAGTRRPRPGGLTPDVEQVGPVGEQAACVRDRRVGLEPLTAVAERVGGDVDDAHDQRSGAVGERPRGMPPAHRGQPLRGCGGGHRFPPSSSAMASARVAGLRNWPRTAEVIVRDPGFLTPRMDMHRCSHSRTTMQPWTPR